MPQALPLRSILSVIASGLLVLVGWFGLPTPAVAAPFSVGIITQPLTPALPLVAAIFHFAGTRPDNLGFQDGKFAACPSTPNCVSSQSPDSQHQIDPLTYEGTAEQAWANLKGVVEKLPGAAIISDSGDYLYAEFTSNLMGFVDDVEFALDPEQHQIQVRSASRLGESDLGVNRKRVETIRTEFGQA